MTAPSAAKKVRISLEHEEQKLKRSRLWIDSERLPTRLAQKGREQPSLLMARPPKYGDADNYYLRLAEICEETEGTLEP